MRFSHNRNHVVKDWLKRIDESEGGIDNFSQGYKYYGIHIQHDNSVIAHEWAPGAKEVFLTGDFSEFHAISLFLKIIFKKFLRQLAMAFTSLH